MLLLKVLMKRHQFLSGTVIIPRNKMLYLMMHSTHFICSYVVRHMVEDHSDSVKGNLLLPLHGLLFPVSSKEFSICTILQTE